MRSKELEQKLNEIHQQLTALGDLNALVEQSRGLPGVLGDAETKKNELQSFFAELSSQKEKLQNLLSEAATLNEQIGKRNEEIGALDEQTKSLHEKTEQLSQEVLTQLGKASNEKLANSFGKVKENLEGEKTKWFRWLVGSVSVLIVATLLIIGWQIYEGKTIFELSFLVKIALTSPLVYFVVFINREYSRVRNLIEEYSFKEAIARSFEAYKDIIEGIFSDHQVNIFQAKLSFILHAIGGLYSSPMDNIKNNSHKEQENTPDLISKLQQVASDVPKE